MDRRTFLGASLAAGVAGGIARASPATPIETRWTVRGSEGFDALSFLGPLSGDPFYLRYYEKEVAAFAPRMPAAAMAELRGLKARATAANILLSPFLDLRFSAGRDRSIDDLLAAAGDPDGMLLPAFRVSPYWDGDEDWAEFKAVLPALGNVLGALKVAGFAAFRDALVAPKADRFEQLAASLAGFDVIAGAEFYTGRDFDPRIEIILLHFCKPHGIKVIGQRFLSAIDWSDAVHIRTAGHEILHPPIDPDGAASKAALAVLGRDPLLRRIVAEHDPKFGYNSLEGLFDEDLASVLDQLIAERFGVARDPAERWSEVDDGMHVLAAGLYGLMQADGYARTGGDIERWIHRQASGGALLPASLHAAAARTLGRPADRLWPVPKPRA